MKVCIIFRGDNVRESQSRRYIDVLMCWNNLKKTISDDLLNNGHLLDIVFITYQSEIIENIKNIINPKYIVINNKITQEENFNDVLTFMNNYKNEYDRFVILRCDFMYRIPITKWPKWKENGIILVNRDVHWPNQRLYSDIIFITDSEFIDIFTNAFNRDSHYHTAHALGRYLYNNNIPFHLMYEDYYHMDKHPLHLFAPLEDEPDLNNPVVFEPITDISCWN